MNPLTDIPPRADTSPGHDWWPHQPGNFRDWLDTMRVLRPLGGASSGNRIRMFTDGDDAFESMWAAIDSAKSRVWLETFIFEPDAVGAETIARLRAAQLRGCEVILMYDYVGSYALKNSFLDPLRSVGGMTVPFNSVLPWHRIGPLKFRNHRKVLVIDNACAFCGGMNIGADYAAARHGTGRFLDVHLRIEGPAVGHFAVLFEESLRQSGARPELGGRVRRWLTSHKRWLGPEELWQLQVLGSNGFGKRRAIQRALRFALRRARSHCHITTPYFVPPPALSRALLAAAQRGVEVRIITAGDTAAPLARRAAQHVYGQFLRRGVKIYELFGRSLHAKTISIDNVFASVGSFNLDTWSHRNLEANVIAIDPELSRRVEDLFQSILTSSEQVTFADWKKRPHLRRLLDRGAYWLMH